MLPIHQEYTHEGECRLLEYEWNVHQEEMAEQTNMFFTFLLILDNHNKLWEGRSFVITDHVDVVDKVSNEILLPIR